MACGGMSSKKVLLKKSNSVADEIIVQLQKSAIDEWPSILDIRNRSLEHARAVDRVCTQIKHFLKRQLSHK